MESPTIWGRFHETDGVCLWENTHVSVFMIWQPTWIFRFLQTSLTLPMYFAVTIHEITMIHSVCWLAQLPVSPTPVGRKVKKSTSSETGAMLMAHSLDATNGQNPTTDNCHCFGSQHQMNLRISKDQNKAKVTSGWFPLQSKNSIPCVRVKRKNISLKSPPRLTMKPCMPVPLEWEVDGKSLWQKACTNQSNRSNSVTVAYAIRPDWITATSITANWWYHRIVPYSHISATSFLKKCLKLFSQKLKI